MWDAETRSLFAGDAIYDGPLTDCVPESDTADDVATMRQPRELPVHVVQPGHDPSFGRDRMVEIADTYRTRAGETP